MDIISASIGFVVAIITVLTTVATNKKVKETLVNKLIRTLKNKKVLSLEDIKNHDIFNKLKRLITYSISMHPSSTIIQNEKKLTLFENYVSIICESYLKSIQRIVELCTEDLTPNELENILIDEALTREKEEYSKFKEYLLNINSNINEVELVLNKLKTWKTTELLIMEDNVISVLNSSRFNSLEYRIDTVFTMYSLGIDFLLKVGAESFEKLNGQIEKFLIDG